MKNILKLLLILSLTAGLFADKKQSSEEVDYISLAAVLISDGFFDRAENALKSVDLSKKSIDKIRFYTLRGLIHLKKQNYEPAIGDFLESIAQGQTEKSIYVYLAQAHYALKEYQKTIDALDKAGENGKEKPELFSIKAQCYWKLDKHSKAWSVLDEAQAKFEDYPLFLRQRFFYLIELGLFEKAMDYAKNYLAAGKIKADDYLSFASAFRKNGATDKAIYVLETAKANYPDDETIIIELAHSYLEQERIITAAKLFEEASIRKNKYSQEASELFRRGKQLYHALYLNTKINDQKEKLKQRLAIFLEFGDYERAAAMKEALSRVGLLEDEDIKYALAYSQYEVGDFANAENNLRVLTRPDLFKKATELRKTMQECKNDQTKCN